MISVDWGNRIINVPQSYLSFISGSSYLLDTNMLRLDLKALEASDAGMPYPDTHRHNTTVTISGVQYARTLEIINGYTVTFEDGLYSVSLTGTNNNILDVNNFNNVSIAANNSAGLVGVGSAQDVANAVWDADQADHSVPLSMGAKLKKLLERNFWLGNN